MTILVSLTGCEVEDTYLIKEADLQVRPGLNLLSMEVAVKDNQGEVVVFVPGAPCDYQQWGLHQSMLLAAGYRAIAYNRRYDEPREPDRSLLPRSVQAYAGDLQRFVDGMDLDQVHLVGHSFGAYAALLYALDHPDRVRSLTITEPPILPWLDEPAVDPSIAVEPLKSRVHAEMVQPVREAFESGDNSRAAEILLDFFFVGGNSSKWIWPPTAMRCRNSPELKSLLVSDDGFPAINKSRIRGFDVPTLVLSGALATEFGEFIDCELDALLPPPTHERVVIERAGHFVWTDNSRACEAALLAFLDSQ
jgi:pimeloyl-ACP methyl ester carboxylesterase